MSTLPPSTSQWMRALGPAWPRLQHDSPTERSRIVGPLSGYWENRLTRIPSDFLSRATAAKYKGLSERDDLRLTAGFGKVREAASLESHAFWFFDVGSAAWGLALGESYGRMGTRTARVDALMDRWRKSGLANLMEEDFPEGETSEETGWLRTLRGLQALWTENDPLKAERLIDSALSRIPPGSHDLLKVSVPLTFALSALARGAPGEAESILVAALEDPSYWTEREWMELLYHYARLEIVSDEASAVQRLMDIGQRDADFLLRALSDPIWEDTELSGLLAAESETERTRMILWRQRVPVQQPDPFMEVRLHLGFPDAYGVFAAGVARQNALSAGAQEPYVAPSEFAHQIRAVKEFAARAPRSMPLCIAGGPPVFEGAGNWMAEVDRQLLDEVTPELVASVRFHFEILPRVVTAALYQHAQRLAESLKAAYDLARGGGDTAYARFLGRTGQRVLQIATGVEDLPTGTGSHLGRVTSEIWDGLAKLDQEWQEMITRRRGRLLLKPDTGFVIAPGEEKGFQCVLVDVGGAPVPGVPVFWRVISGPAVARDPHDCLSDNWARSLQTGVVYFPVETDDDAPLGSTGEISARVMGSSVETVFPYRVQPPGTAFQG